jgi:hypothetical protein
MEAGSIVFLDGVNQARAGFSGFRISRLGGPAKVSLLLVLLEAQINAPLSLNDSSLADKICGL